MSPVFDDSFMHVVIRLHVNIPMTQRRVRTKTSDFAMSSDIDDGKWMRY